jgi:hypothetical protein
MFAWRGEDVDGGVAARENDQRRPGADDLEIARARVPSLRAFDRVVRELVVYGVDLHQPSSEWMAARSAASRRMYSGSRGGRSTASGPMGTRDRTGLVAASPIGDVASGSATGPDPMGTGSAAVDVITGHAVDVYQSAYVTPHRDQLEREDALARLLESGFGE